MLPRHRELFARGRELLSRLAQLPLRFREALRLEGHEVPRGLLLLGDGSGLPRLRDGELGLATGDVRQIARAIAARVVGKGLLGLIERDLRFVHHLRLELRGLPRLGFLVHRARVGELARRERRTTRDQRDQREDGSPNDSA